MKLLNPTKEQKDLCRLITCEFRVSYPHLFVPQAPPGSDKKKFSITMLLDKTKDMTGLSPEGEPRTFQNIMTRAKLNFLGPKVDWPEGIVSPWIDGDVPNKKGEVREGYAGCRILTAKANVDQRPSVVGPDMEPITDANLLYPGCYARAYIQAYVHEYMGTIRVLLSLDHVQKIRDGKSFGGKKPVEQVFRPIVGAAAADESDDDDDLDFK